MLLHAAIMMMLSVMTIIARPKDCGRPQIFSSLAYGSLMRPGMRLAMMLMVDVRECRLKLLVT